MCLRPKRRASTEQQPGPSIASAAPSYTEMDERPRICGMGQIVHAGAIGKIPERARRRSLDRVRAVPAG